MNFKVVFSTPLRIIIIILLQLLCLCLVLTYKLMKSKNQTPYRPMALGKLTLQTPLVFLWPDSADLGSIYCLLLLFSALSSPLGVRDTFDLASVTSPVISLLTVSVHCPDTLCPPLPAPPAPAVCSLPPLQVSFIRCDSEYSSLCLPW